MKLQLQPNDWSCLVTAFSMATDIDFNTFIEHIGHDGSEIIYPDLGEPFWRRSFHEQEVINVALLHGLSVTRIDRKPQSYVDETHSFNLPNVYLKDYLEKYTGVLVGIGSKNTPHAVAWDGYNVIDPNGTIYKIANFRIWTFYIICKI